MSLTKRIGSILREAREARKLTIADVSRETNIIPKYLDALEKEDYSAFPGETYALGFLRSYAEYLNLQAEQILDLYRGHQIDQVQTPVKELTRPLHVKSYAGLYMLTDRKNLTIASVVIAAAALISLIVFGAIQIPSIFKGSETMEANKIAAVCESRRIEPIALPGSGSPARTENMAFDNSVMFVVDTLNLKMCLLEVDRSSGVPVAEFQIETAEGDVYKFQAAEGETVSLNSSVEVLKNINRDIKVTPSVLGDVSARIALESGSVESAPATGIRVTLQFIDSSYLEWTDDGKSHRGVTIAAGETKVFEAKNRLDIKVGNGGGVRILRDGEAPRVAGPRGKIVKMTYRMAPDPLDPGMYRVAESIEVQ